MTFGKFETPEKLFEAYQNLEKDYTRKSQELAYLKKSDAAQLRLNDETAASAQLSGSDGTIETRDAGLDSIDDATGDFAKKEQTIVTQDAGDLCANELEVKDSLKEEPESCLENGAQSPVWQNPMWISIANEFFESHQVAASLKDEILSELASDKALACGDDALARAAERVVGREIVFGGKNFSELAKAMAGLDAVRDAVLLSYTRELAGRHFAPPTLSSNASASVISGKPKYKSIREAGEELLKRL